MLRVLVALLLLNAALTFHNVWPTPGVSWSGDLSVELAIALLLAAGLERWRSGVSRRLVRPAAAIWLLLAFGRYVSVTAPALWGREINAYWDLRFVPDVAAMLARAARPWLVAAAVIAVIAALIAMFMMLRWSFARVAGAMAAPKSRRVLAGLATAMIALFAVERAADRESWLPRFATPVTYAYARQVRFVVDAVSGSRTLPPSPSFDSDLSLVSGADVLLVFMESYGAVTFERPEFAGPLAVARTALDAAIRDSGRRVVSAFVTSPTFGGSSWFAHITLLSGLEVGDPDLNALLMTERRDTLPTAFARHGYRSIALMPGLWYPWPEGVFYGFADTYNGERLQYQGPPFGWWALPDQFTLAKLNALELAAKERAPAFVFFPTVSTHTPFSPTPPYQANWPRMLTPLPFDEGEMMRAYDQDVDWTDLGPSYVRAVDYAYKTIAGYLREPASRDFVMILIGDHQPPALVSGEGAPWDVPVHIITNRQAILDRLTAQGFRDGLTPSRPTLGPMQTLLPVMLKAFGNHPS